MDSETRSFPDVQENVLGQPESGLLRLLESSAGLVIQKDLEKTRWWKDANVLLEQDEVWGLNRFNKNKTTCDSFCWISDQDEPQLKKFFNQTCDPEREGSELFKTPRSDVILCEGPEETSNQLNKLGTKNFEITLNKTQNLEKEGGASKVEGGVSKEGVASVNKGGASETLKSHRFDNEELIRSDIKEEKMIDNEKFVLKKKQITLEEEESGSTEFQSRSTEVQAASTEDRSGSTEVQAGSTEDQSGSSVDLSGSSVDQTRKSQPCGKDVSKELRMTEAHVKYQIEAKEAMSSRSSVWEYVEKVKKQMHPWIHGYPWIPEVLSEDSRSESSVSHPGSDQDSETVGGQIKEKDEKISAYRVFIWEYVRNIKNQRFYPWRPVDSEGSRDQSPRSQRSAGEDPRIQQDLKSIKDQMRRDKDEAAERVSASRSYVWECFEKIKNQSLDSWRIQDPELFRDPSAKLQSCISDLKNKNNDSAENVSTSKSYIWECIQKVKNQKIYSWRPEDQSVDPPESQSSGKSTVQDLKEAGVLDYFAGKLSEAYKDTRAILQSVRVDEMKFIVSHYVSMVSKGLIQAGPEPPNTTQHKVCLVDLSENGSVAPQGYGVSVVSGLSEWPEGSVSSVRTTSPEEFHQRLVQLPPPLSRLQSLSSQQVLEQMASLLPPRPGAKVLSVFWMEAASWKQPRPTPACLLLSETDLVVVSAGPEPGETLTLFHHLDLVEIKEVQISLAGQHIRLIGRREDSVLAVFTHNKALTQEFCKVLLKARCPQASELTEAHPLLSQDLMDLSLDWTSNVPDVVVDNGLYITNRFKRVLADLLYIVHGNMEGLDKPSLAHICPLLYTSVKVETSTQDHQDAMFHFLLTDTHVALLQEDGVFHPLPRGSSLVPAQPQFQSLRLWRRADIRCVLVRKEGWCLSTELIFAKSSAAKRSRSSAEAPTDSWKLVFSCSSEAQVLIHQLCV